jgi:hypothetical protein
VRTFATLSIAAVGLLGLGVNAAAAPGFAPVDGQYRGEYTSGEHGPGAVQLQVEMLRPGLHGVRLVDWSGKLHCDGEKTRTVHTRMTAARDRRSFSGYLTSISPPREYSFEGRFTETDALKATVRVTRGSGADRCDTGPISFVAQLVEP